MGRSYVVAVESTVGMQRATIVWHRSCKALALLATLCIFVVG